MMYGDGISREGDLIDLGIEDKLVEKSGSWFNYGDLRLGQGRENAKQFLKENPELANEIERKLRQSLGLTPIDAPAPAATPPPDIRDSVEAVKEKEKARR